MLAIVWIRKDLLKCALRQADPIVSSSRLRAGVEARVFLDQGDARQQIRIARSRTDAPDLRRARAPEAHLPHDILARSRIGAIASDAERIGKQRNGHAEPLFHDLLRSLQAVTH